LNAAICVPWRGGKASRERLWDMVRPHYEKMPWPLFTGDGDPSLPFNRSAARNAAARAAGERDVYIFVDADTYVPEAQLAQAALFAHINKGAAFAAETFLSMHPVTGETENRRTLISLPYMPSGNIAISREAFERVGGWDERFDGWGWEDGALAMLLYHTGPLVNIRGTMVTFEHTREENEDPATVMQRGKPDIITAEYDSVKDRETAEALIRARRT